MGLRFEGKVVIVTGGGSGIGEAIAMRLAEEGASVVIAGRTAGTLEVVADAIRAAGGTAICQLADVSVEADVEALIARTITEFGRLDVLVNNAGSGVLARITEMTTEQWRQVLATDFDSLFFACRAAMPHLKETRGNIVNIGSISGMGGDNGMSAYNGAKGGAINYSRALAVDCAEYGVRVNCVSPGLVNTPTMARIISFAGHLWDERVPLGRPGLAVEIAGGVAYIASDDATYVTGHNLVIDGGLTAHTGQPSMLKILGR